MCNGVEREGVKVSPDLASGLFCYVPLHTIRYGILRETFFFEIGDDSGSCFPLEVAAPARYW